MPHPAARPLDRPYRGSGSDRPTGIPLPPNRLPLLWGGRLLKQWRYVSIWSEALSVCAARVVVAGIPQAFWAVWDRGGRTLYEKTRLFGDHVHFPTGRVVVHDGDTFFDIAFDDAEALEIVTPVGSAYTWTRKQGGVRAHGVVRVGGVEHRLEARALIDDSAGYHPRRTRWQWSSGAGVSNDGRRVAWNAVVGLNDPLHNSERTVWVDDQAVEIGPVTFADDLSWLRFAEGGELRFTQEAVRERRDNLLLIRSAYRQPFGTFSGSLPGGLSVRTAFGVMEAHDALW